MAESWKTEKFRKSVVDKINEELQGFKLKAETPGNKVENDIYEKARSKRHYLGYVAKIILDIRRMICIQDTWLDDHIPNTSEDIWKKIGKHIYPKLSSPFYICYKKNVKEILTKPPPRLRRVLPTSELAKYNIEVMRLKNRIDQEMKIKSNYK